MTEGGDRAPTSRTSPRIGAVLQVRYRNAGQFLVSYCTNLSRGGLFVTTDRPRQTGDLVTLSLEIPGLDEPAMLAARVCWTRPCSDDFGPAGMGLRFEQLDEVMGRQIDALIADMRPLQVALLGRPSTSWSHTAAMLVSMVHCETRIYELATVEMAELGRCDLVVVDITYNPDGILSVLERLAASEDGPVPALALAGAGAGTSIARASRVAQVVRLPTDTGTLQAKLLEALGQVCAAR